MTALATCAGCGAPVRPRYCSRGCAAKLRPGATLGWKAASAIRREVAAGVPKSEIARARGVSRTTVWRIAAGKTWRLS